LGRAYANAKRSSNQTTIVEMSFMLDRIRIVLVEPRHPGNIGSAVRAVEKDEDPQRALRTLRI
jgi:hypothetical protein